MNRRNFLKRVGLTLGAAFIAVPSIQKSSIPKRKLKAGWTQELERDLKCYHGLDADEQLSRMLSEEVQKEIDNEILEILRGNSQYGKNAEKMRFEYS